MAKLVVVGQGYVGLPLAILAARKGHSVVGYDVDVSRVDRVRSARSFVDDISDEDIARVLASGSYMITADPAELPDFEVAILAVPTPLHEGAPDLNPIRAAAESVALRLRPGALVVLESTTYPGTTEELLVPVLEAGSGLCAGRDFHVGYSPERIDPGNPAWHLEKTPKIVSGIDEASRKAVTALYETIVETVVVVDSPRVAEMAKLVENTFRYINVALANEMAVFARDLEIDFWQAIDAAATKPFGFMRFAPGPGVGGHCLPVDPVYLSWHVHRRLGRPFRFVELANDINSHMPVYVVQRVVEALNDRQRALNGSRILLLGLAYKANSGDARESPAVRVAERLIELGADVRAVDPHLIEAPRLHERVAIVELTGEELTAADVVVVLTDHDAFDYALVREHARHVLDCRNRVGARHNVEVL